MLIAELSKINIHYKIYGHDNHETIVLISGFGADHKIWAFVIPLLAKAYKVIVFDNRAIGYTKDDNLPFNIETMADDTAQLLGFLSIKRANIVGHSMGGIIAQKFAIKYPHLTEKLVIINSSSYAHNTLKFVLSHNNYLWHKTALEPQDRVKLFLPWLFSNQFLSNDIYVEAFINSTLYEQNPQSLDDQSRQLNALIKADLRDELSLINCDAMVVSANEDILTPPFINQEILKYIKKSILVSIPGGHISQIEHPELLAETILSFL